MMNTPTTDPAQGSEATAAEQRKLNTIREIYPEYTLATLRANQARAVESAMQQAQKAMKNGDVERAQLLLDLAGTIETEGE